MNKTLAVSLACAAGAAVPLSSTAQSYPSRPIRIIAQFQPGTSTDILARVIAQKLTESLGQQVVVDNRPGAGAIVGTEIGAHAVPDGYTLTMGVSSAFGINPTLYSKLPYDALRDFAPITNIALTPQTLVISPSNPAKTVKELVAAAKAKPGAIAFASLGSGSTSHLTMEMFRSMAGIQLNHIPYKGSPAAHGDVMTGQVQIMFDAIPATLPHIKSGRLRGLGIGSKTRSPLAPEVPTIAESGYPGFEAVGWIGIVAPAKTPTPILDKLNAEIVRIMAQSDVKERLNTLAFQPVPGTRAEFGAFMKAEIAKWGKVVRDSGGEGGLSVPINVRRAPISFAIALLIAANPAAAAQPGGYPTKPVRLLVPAPPGGTSDLLARVVGAKLAAQLGQQVVIDNRGGAGGVVATELLARSVPDGHTLGLVYTPHTNQPSFTRLPYDPVNDFSPITMMTSAPLVLVVHPPLPVKSVKDLIALAKSKPIVYGSAGNGSGGHLSGELLKMMSGIQATHVPYKGAGPAAVDVIAGQLQFQFAAQITVDAFLKSGRLRALAVTSAQRASTLPELPTVAESGVPGFEVINWFGIFGPARMPEPLQQRLYTEIATALRSPEVRDKLVAQGSEIVASTPQQFRAFIIDDIRKWAKVVKAAGIRAD